MNIHFLDLKTPYLELRDELDAAFRRMMESGWYIPGQEVEAFEAEVADYYLKGLAAVNDLLLPQVPDWAEPVWHLFVVRHVGRDALQQRLQQVGIGTMVHYPIPPHLQPAYAELGLHAGAYPVAEQIACQVLSLPMGPHMAGDQLRAVVTGLRQCL